MLTKEKLKELRKKQNLTQEEVAEAIGVSAQTVSKWERGLLQPDLNVLPRLAALYKTTLDAMFGMESNWDAEHGKTMWQTYRSLRDQGDVEGMYQLLLHEAELRPHMFSLYCDVMRHVWREKLFDDVHVNRMIQLAEYAEQYCDVRNTLNEINTNMVRICRGANNPEIRAKVKTYWLKLPLIRHCRESLYGLLPPEELNPEYMKYHVFSALDKAEACIRQLVSPDMTDEEKLYYYEKSAALMELYLEDGYGGFFEGSLLNNYVLLACCHAHLQHADQTEKYMRKVFNRLEQHLSEEARQQIAPMVPAETHPHGYTPPEDSVLHLLKCISATPELADFHREAIELEQRYRNYFRK